MKAYIPVNIKTGQVYPAISEQEKREWEADPMVNGGARKRYKFRETNAAPPVKEAKTAEAKPKKETAQPPVEAKRVEDIPNEPK